MTYGTEHVWIFLNKHCSYHAKNQNVIFWQRKKKCAQGAQKKKNRKKCKMDSEYTNNRKLSPKNTMRHTHNIILCRESTLFLCSLKSAQSQTKPDTQKNREEKKHQTTKWIRKKKYNGCAYMQKHDVEKECCSRVK